MGIGLIKAERASRDGVTSVVLPARLGAERESESGSLPLESDPVLSPAPAAAFWIGTAAWSGLEPDRARQASEPSGTVRGDCPASSPEPGSSLGQRRPT